MKIFLLSVVFFIMVSSAWAQHSSNSYYDLADSLYTQHHYQYAARYFEKALKKSKNQADIMLRIGKSYAKVNAIDKAEEWFGKARLNNARFSNEDTYQYAQVLTMQGKRKEAERVLKELLMKDSNARKEKEFLNDLVQYKKYYQDSARFKVESLTINTDVSEFAPAFYKDGIVYASATPEKKGKRKYHWDDSHYLNLMYSKLSDHQLQKPVFFEKDLNTKFHDGPAVFYNNYNSMVVNRNIQGTNKNRTHDLWHIALLDAQYMQESSSWKVSPLPFDEPPYSFSHPHISEDGKVLFFISDKPGGYGGMDIYKSVRVEGKWSEPYNVGPAINTDDDEVSPFFIDNTLYFSSNGRGGLGGLDIYKSTQTVNGYSHPINLGYPINSSRDDFSFIMANDLTTGYFSSSRNGNDDLFSFEIIPAIIQMLVHTYDGATDESLAGAVVQVINTTKDFTFVADEEGKFKCELPEDSDFIMIATKDDKVGMLMGVASAETGLDRFTHQLAAFSDTTLIACIGTVKNKEGIIQKASSVSVIDEMTNKEVAHFNDNALINFVGQKNRKYRIEISNEKGDTTIQRIQIREDEKAAITWTMLLKDANPGLMMSARIFKFDTKEPLSNAEVKIITFSDAVVELNANDVGVVNYTLPEGTAYLLVGSTDQYTGMYSGVVERSTPENPGLIPVPAFREKTNEEKLLVGLITDAVGNIIKDAVAFVTDKISGETIPVKIKDGVLYFQGESDKTYSLTVEHDNYNTTREEYTLSGDRNNVENFTVVLHKPETSADIKMAVRVISGGDQSILPGADVTIINYIEADEELEADKHGEAQFSLAEGVAFLVIAQKDGMTGSFMGIAEIGQSKEFVVHPVSVSGKAVNLVPVVAKIVGRAGEPISSARFLVEDLSTGKMLEYQHVQDMMSFMGESGKDYLITVEDDHHQKLTHKVSFGDTDNSVYKISLVMDKIMPDVSSEKSQNIIVPVANARTREMIIFETDGGAPKVYLNHNSVMAELIEKDGELFLQHEKASERLGEGRLSTISDHKEILKRLEVSSTEIIRLKNIYFAFNSAQLDANDKAELEKVREVLKQYSGLKLVVSAHADDRGQDAYNLNLSRKRAKAIGTYLLKTGVPGYRIIQEAMGESLPAVLCESRDCTEDEHQRNRRAEFVLRISSEVSKGSFMKDSVVRKSAPDKSIAPDNKESAYESMLKKVGDKTIDGVIFKVCIGAYRFNSTLSFVALNDLGNIETITRNEITYYYLAGFPNLNEAESIRKKVKDRNIADAFVSIHYNGKTITLKEFMML